MSPTARIATATMIAMLALGSTAQAQDTPKADKSAKAVKALEDRFAAADKDHDGKLTKTEADAGMPRLAKNFDKVDADKKGFVTLDEVKTYAAKNMRK